MPPHSPAPASLVHPYPSVGIARFAALLLCGIAVAVGCAESDVPSSSGEVNMGLDEGTLSSGDARFTFSVAATTLSENIRFKVTSIPATLPFAAGVTSGRTPVAYHISPAMRFPPGATARLTISYAGLVAADEDARDLGLVRLDGTDKIVFPTVKPNPAEGTFSATVDATGTYLLVKRGCKELIAKLADCGDAGLQGEAAQDAERLACYRANTATSRYSSPWRNWCHVYTGCAERHDQCDPLVDGAPPAGNGDTDGELE